jgi:hypothetical protein
MQLTPSVTSGRGGIITFARAILLEDTCGCRFGIWRVVDKPRQVDKRQWHTILVRIQREADLLLGEYVASEPCLEAINLTPGERRR